MRFTREGSRYRADILEVLPGGGWQMRSNPPSYPKRPLRDGVGAYVLAYVQYDETGRVDMSKSRIERVIAGSSAGEVQGDALERVNASFSQSVESAMARWRYTPDEVDGKPVAAAVLVPTVFCVDEAWKDCRAVLSAQGQAEASLAAPLDSQVRVAQMKPAPSDEG